MTDRELLEAAAKAAGMRLTWDGDNPPYPRATTDGHWNPSWNPLERDGDALRLAVSTLLTVQIDAESMEAQAIGWGGVHASEKFTTKANSYAALRRAIVRAAAAIRLPADQPEQQAHSGYSSGGSITRVSSIRARPRPPRRTR
jgi:hypothetical protein